MALEILISKEYIDDGYPESLLRQGLKAHKTAELTNISFKAPVFIAPRALIGDGCTIGAWSYIGEGSSLSAKTEIGAFCSIAADVVMGPFEHPTHWATTHPFVWSHAPFDFVQQSRTFPKCGWDKAENPEPIVIGNDVWIGRGVYIMSGVTIGNGAIIGTRAVVTKDVSPYAIVGGVPAKVIRFRFSAELIKRLLASEWWKIDFEELSQADFTDINKFLTWVESR